MKTRLAPAAFCLCLALGACAAEPPPPPVTAAPPPPAAPAHPKRDPNAALTESLRAALIRSEEALKQGKIDASAFERIVIAHQRAVAAMAAINALGWGNYPPLPQPAPGAAPPSPRPPTRIEAIERIMEMLNREEEPERHRKHPRR